jgi:tape measure domain-containing protein
MSATAQEFRIDITARDNAAAIIERLRKSVDATARSTEDIGRSAQRAERGVSDLGAGFAGLKGLAIGVATSLASAFSGAAFMRAANEFTNMQNSLRTAGLEGERLKQTYQDIFAIGQQQGVGAGGLASLFAGLSQSTRDLKASESEMLQFTSGVATALRVAGTDAQQASGALLQLRQAIGGTTVQAEEFNSMLDGARPILQAVANGLVEAGGSIGKLRDLVREGEVSAQAFFRAFLAGKGTLDDMASRAIPTVGQASERLRNSFNDLSGKLDETLEVSRTFGRWGNEFSQWIDQQGAPAVIRWAKSFAEFRDAVRAGNDGLKEVRQSLNNIGSWSGWSRLSGLMGGATTPEQMLRAGLTPVPNGSSSILGLDVGEGGFSFPAPSIPPVSLEDYGSDDDEGAGSRSGRGSTGPSPFEQFQREIAGIEARRRALENEALTLNMSTEAITRSKTAFDLREAAGRLNVELTPTLLASIDTASTAFARQTAEIERQREAFRSQNEFIRFAGTSISSFFSDITSGGKNASEAVMNLTKRLADMALQSALLGDGPLAGLFGTRGQNGNVGGLFGALGGLFRSPMATAGPMNLIPSLDVGAWNVRNDGLAMIHKGETVLPTADAEDFRSGQMGSMRGERLDIRIGLDDGVRAEIAGTASHYAKVEVDRLRSEVPALSLGAIQRARMNGQLP